MYQLPTLMFSPKAFLLFLLISFSFSLVAQVPTTQDCLGAIPVCEQIYIENTSPSGFGNYSNEVNGAGQGGICCMANDNNSIWYTFTVNESGNFGFVLTPNDLDDDYDWGLFDITDKSCADIFSDASMQVSCNAAGGLGCHGATGANGNTNLDNVFGGCAGNNSPFNALVPVQQGNTYVLLVSNWSSSPNGYTIDFGQSGDIGIIDELIPEISDLEVPDVCGGGEFVVTFSEYIQCNTIDGSNFEITGPGGPYSITAFGNSCTQGGNYDKDFTLFVNPPIIEAGNYSIALVSDGVTDVLDLCDNPSSTSSYDFEILFSSLAPINLGNDTTLCEGETVTLDAGLENADTYLWQDGSTDSVYTITQSGNYQVSITNECNTVVDDIFVDFDPVLTLEIDLGLDTILCEGEVLTLNATSANADNYEWQDGSTNAVYNITQAGDYEVLISNGCNQVMDAIFVDFIPVQPLNTNLGVDTILCEGEIFILDATTADADFYEWQDGSTAPTFEVAEAGIYQVTITNECSEQVDNIAINFVPLQTVEIDLGADTMLCPGTLYTLDGTWNNGIQYVWQDGSMGAIYTVSESGVYEVQTLGACGEEGSAMVEVLYDETQLAVNLGVDSTLCEEDGTYILNATDGNAETYLWQDGSTSSSFRVEEDGTYAVTLTDECNVVMDSVALRFTNCTLCEVFVPNAFSPDFNGFNDEFRPFSNCSLENYSMKIFNRWGALLFESSNAETGWDGRFDNKDIGEGVYIYLLEFEVNEFGEFNKRKLTGDVTVVK